MIGAVLFTFDDQTPVSRLDGDHACHMRVKRTEITELPRLGESEGVTVASIEDFRLEEPVLRYDRVRDIVAVGPGDRRSRLDRQHGRLECEIFYGHSSGR